VHSGLWHPITNAVLPVAEPTAVLACKLHAAACCRTASGSATWSAADSVALHMFLCTAGDAYAVQFDPLLQPPGGWLYTSHADKQCKRSTAKMTSAGFVRMLCRCAGDRLHAAELLASDVVLRCRQGVLPFAGRDREAGEGGRAPPPEPVLADVEADPRGQGACQVTDVPRRRQDARRPLRGGQEWRGRHARD
jgi:hypothetical protein